MSQITQTPSPGTSLLNVCGDLLRIVVTMPPDVHGEAVLRSNLGRVDRRRREVIAEAEGGRPAMGHDWHDMTIPRQRDGFHEILLPVTEVGNFRAKTYFLPDGSDTPVWPEGDDLKIKVAPAWTFCGNSLYSAFVRQFGPYERETVATHPAISELDQEGYTVVPPSGTFRDLIAQLDTIIDKMGFRILQLLPIHPTPTTYARMGRYGSPFAGLDFLSVDPALATFDPRATPLDQFGELIDAVHARGARLFIDLPANHTGWASTLQTHHPEWFRRDDDRSFVSPGAWGVTWADLSELDYENQRLWCYMADVFLFWCRQGVDGFRCDAGYMIPEPVWNYIAAKVRLEFPDTVFMLEGLGGPLETTRSLLESNNLDWAYSEIFQTETREQMQDYLPDALALSQQCGPLINFAETHDNRRMAATSHNYARMRTCMSALCSQQGAFAITNGVEWFATEKIDVHDASPLRWGAPDNQVELITTLNRLLRRHPAFRADATSTWTDTHGSNVMAMVRRAKEHTLLIVVNLDAERPGWIEWEDAVCPVGDTCYDLLREQTVSPDREGTTRKLALGPGSCHALSQNAWQQDDATDARLHHAMRALALETLMALGRYGDVSHYNVDQEAKDLYDSPAAFATRHATQGTMPRFTHWQWPTDTRRDVMVPPGHLLLVEAPHPFDLVIWDRDRVRRSAKALPRKNRRFFALIMPFHTPATSRALQLKLRVHAPGGTQRRSCPLRLLARGNSVKVRHCFSREAIHGRDPYLLLTNGAGAMSQIRAEWGEIRSQYDALLAANLNLDVPVDRRVLLARCRIWVRYLDYSCAVDQRYLTRLEGIPGGTSARWSFRVAVGMGLWIPLTLTVQLLPGSNRLLLHLRRGKSEEEAGTLSDATPVTLVVRPDIEDRSCHAKTKAFEGAEHAFPPALEARPDGFRFSPYNHALFVSMNDAQFHPAPDWLYMIPHPVEQQRGLGDCSDLFSPGYFETSLHGNQNTVLSAGTEAPRTAPPTPPAFPGTAAWSLPQVAAKAINSFVVKRETHKTVIAGYPWFLDWGRDTLICLRGMIAAGMHDEAADILKAFGRFEENGTLPNMIRGHDNSDRDTSDAPLWYMLACRDLCESLGRHVLKRKCRNGKTLKTVITAIAHGYSNGTPNGIHMDKESGLVFSPAHFTWMDTNYPPGTPREGYPIEIQALWYAALQFVADITGEPEWAERSEQVKASIMAYFWSPDPGYLSDCLHASPGTPAARATADDALRPNQLFALTLRAITDRRIQEAVLKSSERLLVPGAIRSLADQPLNVPLQIVRDGETLSDPHAPYRGQYGGEEDRSRKPAYHNGTAWCWPFPSYAEALLTTYGPDARETAQALLGSAEALFEDGCILQLPEIVDGDAPHTQRGCGAQAWSITELYRVWQRSVVF